jgi:hypothetical protein
MMAESEMKGQCVTVLGKHKLGVTNVTSNLCTFAGLGLSFVYFTKLTERNNYEETAGLFCSVFGLGRVFEGGSGGGPDK